MYDDIVGVKTGFTKKSGRCLVSASRKDGKFVIAVTLNDRNDWADHRTLLDLGLSLIESKQFSYPDGSIRVPIASGGSVTAQVPAVLINITENSKITYTINADDFLYSPITEGQKIGEIRYYNGETLVCGKDITANNTVKENKSKLNLLFDIFINILSSV